MAKAKKNTQVKFSPEKLQELKDAIISGETPKSIHERLGATIHNIHYHKAELKKKGLLNTGTAKKSAPVKNVVAKKKSVVAKKTVAPATVKHSISGSNPFKLIVNGVSVSIEGAGSVSVGKGFIKIDY